MISSMDFHDGRLFVPTDLTGDCDDLAVLSRDREANPRAPVSTRLRRRCAIHRDREDDGGSVRAPMWRT